MGGSVSVFSSQRVESDYEVEGGGDDVSKHIYLSKTGLCSYFAVKRSEITAPLVCEDTQAMCRASWNDVEFFIGRETFCVKFFQLFDTLHPEAAQLFRPRKKARNTWKYHSRWELLLNVVHFFLRLSDSSFKTKKKLRAIGRKHFLSGVRKDHVKGFNDVLIMCFQSFQCHRDVEMYTRPWLEILDFCAQEMYIEDIQLVHLPPTPISTP
jgi:hypothetical protein